VDRSAVVAISGEVPTDWEGQGGFQDASGPNLDDVEVMRTLCAFSTRVETPVALTPMLREALTVARDRKAPVHLSIPLDVQRAPQTGRWQPLPPAQDSLDFVDEDALERAFAVIGQGHPNIVILAGPGVRHARAADDLRTTAEHWGLPVATTLSAKGILPENHPMSLGVFGYGGNRWATEALLSGDVDILLVVGVALTQRDTLQWDTQMLPRRAFVHVGADPANLTRTWVPDVAVFGTPRTFLRRLAQVDGVAGRALAAGRDRRLDFLREVHGSGPFSYDADTRVSRRVPLHPAAVVHTAREVFPEESVAVVDSGAHRAFAAQHWRAIGSRSYLSATHLGPMGAAVPMAVGSAASRPEVPHVVFTGDGCLLMHGMEVHTAARYGLPLVVVAMDNKSYGNIWYRASELGRPESALTDIPGVDWAAFGTAMGVPTESVSSPAELRPAFEWALARGGPCLIDARIDKAVAKPTVPWETAVREWEDDH
jgi:acetolactate synthase-1/2/3 large subunit